MRASAADAPALLVVSDYVREGPSRPEAEIYLALRRRGYRVAVITHAESAYTRRFRDCGIRVLLGHPTARRDAAGTCVIRDELLRGSYDALVLYNSRAIANGVRAARGIDVAVVAYRGYAGEVRWYDPSNYLKLLHPRVDAILCNNRGVAAHVRRNRWWARRDLTHVVTKGHDLDWYADVPRADRASLGVPADALLAVCVANAQPFKGIPVLLRAMRHVDPALGIHLALCGRGMDAPAHRRLAEASGQADRIHFPGYRDDVLAVVRAADAKVLPSTRGESLTKAVFEAMALGTPVVITDIPGNEELVEHGVSGWKVPPSDPVALARGLERVLGDAELRGRLAAGARERLAGPLSHATTVDAMDAFFRGLVAGRLSPKRQSQESNAA